MATWQEVEAAAPALAAAARALFDAHRHKTVATLRRDGSPRISGIETQFKDGELWLGMMVGSRKARDLQRDPRLALHSASEDPPDDPSQWTGDAKLAGRAVEAVPGGEVEPGSHHFRLDLTEATLTSLHPAGDRIVIETWRPGQGVSRAERT